jgi:hypothetical protein
MAKLKILALKDINSIIINKGVMAKGAPEGKNKPKNLNPCKLSPVKIIIIKHPKDKENVTIIELVEVKQKGINPNVFDSKITKNI